MLKVVIPLRWNLDFDPIIQIDPVYLSMNISHMRRLVCLVIFCIVSGCGTDTPPPVEGNASPAQTPPAEPTGTGAAEIVATETVEEVQEGTATETVEEIQESAASVATVPAIGEETFKKTCALCHGNPGMGAPVMGNLEDWAPRIEKGKDTLYQHALEGYAGETGAMPPRGANPKLDDDTIKATVDYMVAQSQ